jgi:hypothetical protein
MAALAPLPIVEPVEKSNREAGLYVCLEPEGRIPLASRATVPVYK